MAWIKVIEEDEAEGNLKEQYEKLITPHGEVDNILKIHSLNPASLRGHYEFYKILMRGKSDLSRAQREMIAVTVSALNHCVYWVKHHGAGLRNLINDDNLVGQLKKDFRTADLSEAEKAMLEYVAKLTLEPWNMEKSDVEKLRDSGFTDAAILDICQIAGYYAFVNRLADGLGVELENYWWNGWARK